MFGVLNEGKSKIKRIASRSELRKSVSADSQEENDDIYESSHL